MLRMSLIFEAKSFGIIDLFNKNSIFYLLSSNMIRLPEKVYENQQIKNPLEKYKYKTQIYPPPCN